MTKKNVALNEVETHKLNDQAFKCLVTNIRLAMKKGDRSLLGEFLTAMTTSGVDAQQLGEAIYLAREENDGLA